MSTEEDYITLPCGKRFYANCNIIGIDDELGISEGYDGGLPYPPFSEYAKDDIEECFTKQEAIELADIMIARWTKFKEKCNEQ